MAEAYNFGLWYHNKDELRVKEIFMKGIRKGTGKSGYDLQSEEEIRDLIINNTWGKYLIKEILYSVYRPSTILGGVIPIKLGVS